MRDPHTGTNATQAKYEMLGKKYPWWNQYGKWNEMWIWGRSKTNFYI